MLKIAALLGLLLTYGHCQDNCICNRNQVCKDGECVPFDLIPDRLPDSDQSYDSDDSDDNDFPYRSWPNVVKMTGEQALEIIQRDVPDKDVFVLRPGEMITKDMRSDRVVIHVNQDGIVTQVPTVG